MAVSEKIRKFAPKYTPSATMAMPAILLKAGMYRTMTRQQRQFNKYYQLFNIKKFYEYEKTKTFNGSLYGYGWTGRKCCRL